MSTPRMRLSSTPALRIALALCASLLFGACADDVGEEPADSGPDAAADTDTDADADADTDAGPDAGGGLAVELFEPTDGAVVRMNQKIHVVFSAGADGDFVDPATVHILVDGEEVPAWEYRAESEGNREFRFVPFPVWEPSSEHEVTVAAGAAYSGDPSLALAEAFSWTFTVEDAPFDEVYDEAQTPPLDSEELALMEGGDAGVFDDADLVNDWEDPSSALYEVSDPIQPDDAAVAAFAEKMIHSLPGLGAIGLAAPQLGVNRRIFAAKVNGETRAFVNPRVDSWSEEIYYGSPEGCLSIDGVSSLVGRPASISVEFDTPEGDHVTGYELENYQAKVFLHEYDHLNGILMTDREQSRSW